MAGYWPSSVFACLWTKTESRSINTHAFAVQAGHHRAQQIDGQSVLQTSQKENNDRIPFTLKLHPQNHAVESIILKNFKLLQNDPDTGRIFSQPPLISFKRDKNIDNFLVRSAFQTSGQPGTFRCTRAGCKTCPWENIADSNYRWLRVNFRLQRRLIVPGKYFGQGEDWTVRKSAIFPQPSNQKQLKWSNTAYVNEWSFAFKIKLASSK